MPLGIVSDDDFLLELERLKSSQKEKKDRKEKKEIEPNRNDPTNGIKEKSSNVISIDKGRGINNVEVPETLRALIASTAIESGRSEALLLAKQFGISPSSVSAYSHGATSTATYESPAPELKKKINNTKERLGRVARGKLALSLRHITEEKLADAKLRDVASVAASMASVVKQMEPDSQSGNTNQVNIVLYAPRLKSESAYDVIDVSAVDSD